MNLIINNDEYPEIFKLVKKEREKKIKDIFKTGYNIHYPTLNNEGNDANLQYQQILRKLENIELEYYNESGQNFMSNQMEDLMTSIQRLTGLSNNSSKKGEVGEFMLEEIINKRYGDLIYENKAKVAHCGDAWLTFPDGQKIILESKNYTQRINKDELEKMEFDMKTNNIKFGIFLSWSSQVSNFNSLLDIHTFCDNGETFLVIILSKLSDDIQKLDLSIQILRKFLLNFSNLGKFPWVVKELKGNMDKLNMIFKQNHILRDKFYEMNSSIVESMNQYFINLREYQYELEEGVNEIINSIDSTIDESLKDITDNKDNTKDNCMKNYLEYFSEFKKEKIYKVIQFLIDLIASHSIKDNAMNCITLEKNNKEFIILKNGSKISSIKIQKKKIIIQFIHNLTVELDEETFLGSKNYLDKIFEIF